MKHTDRYGGCGTGVGIGERGEHGDCTAFAKHSDCATFEGRGDHTAFAERGDRAAFAGRGTHDRLGGHGVRATFAGRRAHDWLGGRGGYWIYGAVAVLAAAALLWRTSEVSDGVRAGLAACGGVVIPSLFPFMILAGLIGSTRAGTALSRAVYAITRRLPGLKNLPERLGSALLMSFIGGFPVGAQTLSGMVESGEIDSKTASRALCFSVNAGPSFLVSAVGASMLGSRESGLLLLLAQLLSSLVIAAFLFRSPSPTAGMEKRRARQRHATPQDVIHRRNKPYDAEYGRDEMETNAAENRPPRSDRFAATLNTAQRHAKRQENTPPNADHFVAAVRGAGDTPPVSDHFVAAVRGAGDTPPVSDHFVAAVRGTGNTPPSADRFVAAVRGAATGILGICAFVVIFSAISALLASLGVTEFLANTAARLFPAPELGARFFSALFTGLLEVTGGCAAAAALHTRAGFVLCAFLISFSSLSIIFQVKSCFKPDSGVKFSMFYRSRLVHGGLTALFSLPLSLLLPPEILAAAVSTSAPVPSVAPNMAVTTVCLICMCSILLASTSKFSGRTKNLSRHGGNPARHNV